jgi:Erv1/Alr family protein
MQPARGFGRAEVNRAVPPKDWGPPWWEYLHKAAIAYPRAPTVADARAVFERFWKFFSRLPCVKCRAHSSEYLASNPLHLANSESLQRWVWAYHNAVNLRLGKRQISYAEYRELYAAEIRGGAGF